MTAPTRIVVADDHPRTRSQIRRVLETSGFEVVAEAADATGTVAAALHHRPEICLIDVHMPGGGVRAVGEIAVTAPEITLVMYTVSDADEDLFAALRAGAAGYLLKDTDPLRLPLALKGLLTGEAAVPRHLLRRLLEDYRTRPPSRAAIRAGLTDREWDVLELLRHGLTTREIADRLYVAPVTVRSHIASALHKLGARDRTEALRHLDGR